MKNKWIKTIGITLACTMLFSNTVFAATSEELAQQGLDEYNAGNVEEAIEIWEDVYDRSSRDRDMRYWAAKSVGQASYEIGDYYKTLTYMGLALDDCKSDEVGNWLNYIARSEKALGINDLALITAMSMMNYDDAATATSAYARRGEALMAMGEYDEALATFNELLKDENANVLYTKEKIAEVLNAKGDYAAAADAYFALGEEDAEYKSYYVERGMAALANEDESRLPELVNTYLVGEFGYNDLQIANTLCDRGFYEQAVSYYDTVLAAEPENVEAVYWRARSLGSQGKYEEAATGMEQAIALDASYMSGRYLKAYYLLRAGKYEECLTAAQEAIAINPEDYGSYDVMHGAYLNLGQPDAACSALEPLLDKEGVPLYIYIDYIEAKQDITENEIEQLLKKAGEFPENEVWQFYFLSKNLSSGHFTEATLQSYLEYLEGKRWMSGYEPTEILCLEGYGVNMVKAAMHSECAGVYWMLGQYAEAAEAYEQAKAGGESLSMEDILENQVSVYTYARDYENAYAIAKSASESYPENNSFKTSMVYQHLYRGDSASGVSEAEQFLAAASEEDKDIWYPVLTRAYDAAGDFEKALENVNLWLEDSPTSLLAKAYKAKFLQALGQDGADALIAEIDASPNGVCVTTKMLADSILGRLDLIAPHLQVYLENHPQTYRKDWLAYDYDFRTARTNQEIADTLGIQVETIAGMPGAESEPEESESTENGSSDADTSSETGTETTQKSRGINPFAAGGIVLVLGFAGIGIAALVQKKRGQK